MSAFTAPGHGAAPYSTVPADLRRDRATILDLWRSGLAHQGMPEEKVDWYYENNPEGPPDTLLLRAGDVPVGVAAVGRRRMRCGPHSLQGGALVDFVVTPDHRGLFPALFLQRRVREAGLLRFALLFGRPNPQSEAVVRRAGYHHAGDQVRSARVLRSNAYLARHLPRLLSNVVGTVADRARFLATKAKASRGPKLRYAWLDRPDERFDALWESAAAAGPLIGVRDRTFLQWRFVECPFRRYRFFVAQGHDKTCIASYAVCHDSEGTLHVSDFLCDPGVEGASRSMWLHLASHAYRQGYRSLSVEFLGPRRDQEAIKASGMVERARRPVYATFARDADRTHTVDWYLTSADDDT